MRRVNHLSHHAVARRIAPDALPAFFVGNVLPDILAASGVGRLRAAPVANVDAPLARGVRLHHATDRAFHSSPAFAEAMAEAKAVLLATPFAEPPRRVFFLAHAMVEIALDGLLLESDPGHVDHFYAQFTRSDLPAVAQEVALWPGLTFSPTTVQNVLEGFARARYLYHYADAEGLAGALRRIDQRAGLGNFTIPADETRLTEAFAALLPLLARRRDDLLITPPTNG